MTQNHTHLDQIVADAKQLVDQPCSKENEVTSVCVSNCKARGGQRNQLKRAGTNQQADRVTNNGHTDRLSDLRM